MQPSGCSGLGTRWRSSGCGRYPRRRRDGVLRLGVRYGARGCGRAASRGDPGDRAAALRQPWLRHHPTVHLTSIGTSGRPTSDGVSAGEAEHQARRTSPDQPLQHVQLTDADLLQHTQEISARLESLEHALMQRQTESGRRYRRRRSTWPVRVGCAVWQSQAGSGRRRGSRRLVGPHRLCPGGCGSSRRKEPLLVAAAKLPG
jgi:hypothetical protein